MAVSQISICNSALGKVGAERISSIGQSVKSAELLNAIWDQVRDSVLRAHPWNFAIKRVTLAPNSTTPDFGYDFQYDKPNDCLRILDPDPDDVDFQIEGDQILTDEATLDLRYIWRNEDESEWDSCFAEAFAWRLAREIAYSLTQSAALVTACDASYKEALQEARTMDGMEGTIQVDEVSTWTDSRKRSGV